MPISGLFREQRFRARSSPTADLFPFRGFTRRLLPMDRVRELYRRAQQPTGRSLLENLLSEMRIECRVSHADLRRVPASGPLVATANHPFGILDGAILGAVLSRVRPDVKIITNFLLAGIPELHEQCIFVDPFGGEQSACWNVRGLKKAIRWLRGGGAVALFPSGEVSHLKFPARIADPEWLPAAAMLARVSGALALPIFFEGHNSVPFQAMGLVHPRLRTAWLLSEFLQQTDRKVEIRVGSVIPVSTLRRAGGDRERTAYLRWRTYLLAERERRRRPSTVMRTALPPKKQIPISDPVPRENLLREIERLPPEQRLLDNDEFTVYVAEASDTRCLMQELGRLRELTFRASGEGTGLASDLDDFDRHYQHVLLWSKRNAELAGSYRIGRTDRILPQFGVSGLYTSRLFHYDVRLFKTLAPALELGRSFVRPEYQRQYAPLLMLWKGIGRYLAGNPELAVLFGAVSISNRYNRISRELIVRFFSEREHQHEWSRWVRPRRPFRAGWGPFDFEGSRALCRRFQDVEELADPISDLETDGKGLPVLLRQYAKIGGRILSFNVDRKFSDVLDGLIMVDLRQVEPRALERYMGRDGLEAFRRYHGLRGD